jgi:hypothetical protein
VPQLDAINGIVNMRRRAMPVRRDDACGAFARNKNGNVRSGEMP